MATNRINKNWHEVFITPKHAYRSTDNVEPDAVGKQDSFSRFAAFRTSVKPVKENHHRKNTRQNFITRIINKVLKADK